jgi:DNA-binding MarR family transcriptional regulator
MADTFPPSLFATPLLSPGFLLWRVSNLWQRQQRAALHPLDLTHVQFVLLASVAWLTREGEPVTQVRLAQHAGADPMMTSQVVRSLAERGLMIRERHPGDTRAVSLRLTPVGHETLAMALPLVEAVDAAFFDCCPEAALFLQQLLEAQEAG